MNALRPTLVLDASAVAPSILPDEDPAFARAALDEAARNGAFVPDLFWHEIRNLLLKAERRGRTDRAVSDAAIAALRLAGLETAAPCGDDGVMSVARAHGLSGYDAAYAATAAAANLPLATLDARLIAAGKAGAFALWRAPGG